MRLGESVWIVRDVGVLLTSLSIVVAAISNWSSASAGR